MADEFAEARYSYAWPALAAAYEAFQTAQDGWWYEAAHVLELATEHFAKCLKDYLELEREREAKRPEKREVP